ncbi:hypothetical protein [Williamsoniiplasma lucivorax]|uniref:Lipoprotein n=1 Tax=Williamsoniiplasma lucivorax TaxID=209274 RepID=A0A2S5RD60_9MOLU|nr:hypothetical protein [Williamsoniiplasma lucivorax]PPE05240.1 hypothetical protein ELUCI_v1c07760 [Williamsoniiplasma lucivorax]
MKKMLILLSGFTITMMTASTVVACNQPSKMSALNEQIKEAEKLLAINSGKSESAKTNFQNEINKAKKISEKKDATDQEIEDAKIALGVARLTFENA